LIHEKRLNNTGWVYTGKHMANILRFGLAAAALLFVLGRASADDIASETRTIDARTTRLHLDGMMNLVVRQGATPALTIFAEKRTIADIVTSQRGDTLVIDTDVHGFRSGKNAIRAELTIPKLRDIRSEGVGTIDVRGFSGEQLDLSLEGAGRMNVVVDYRTVRATLGGVGNIDLWLETSDEVRFDLQGAGYLTVGGSTRSLKATLGGLGGLNAQRLQAQDVSLELSGLGNASVNASHNATLALSGMGSVTVFGKPRNRNVSVDGLGKVSWK
jgi:hypothetical protein